MYFTVATYIQSIDVNTLRPSVEQIIFVAVRGEFMKPQLANQPTSSIIVMVWQLVPRTTVSGGVAFVAAIQMTRTVSFQQSDALMITWIRLKAG